MSSETRSERLSRGWVVAAAFLLGCFSTTSQVLLFREELVVLAGNEWVLSLLLTGWTLGIAFGALLPRRFSTQHILDSLLPLSLIAIPILFILSVLFLRLSPWLFSLPMEDQPSPLAMAFISLISVLPLGLMIGFAFPVTAAAWNESKKSKTELPSSDKAVGVGSVFTWESFGSAAAGMLLVFWWIPRWDPFTLTAILGGLLLLLFLLRSERRGFSFTLYFILLGIVAFSIGLGAPQSLERWSEQRRWQSRHPGFALKKSLETQYQRLELGERDNQFTVFGNGTPLFSFPNEYEDAQWAHVALSQRPDPESILLIGSGGTDRLQHLAEHQPKSILCIEIDPGIVELTPFSLPGDTMKSTIRWDHTDPRRFLSSLPEEQKFSVIAVNQPDPANGLLNRLYTKEFFQLVHRHLQNNGVFAFTVTGTPNYEFGDVGVYCGTLYWTLRDVFPNVLPIPGMQWWFFASPALPLLSEPDAVIQRFQKQNPDCALFLPDQLSLAYEPLRIEQTLSAFETYAHLPRNTDLRPLCYLYNLLLWSKRYGYLRNFSIEKIPATGSDQLLGGLIAVGALFWVNTLGIRLGIRGKKRSISAPLSALSAAGLAAMGAELSILLFFQCRVGSLYREIGIFFGIFMLGLAAGSAAGTRWVSRARCPAVRLLLRCDRLFIFLLWLTPLVLFIASIPQLPVMSVEILLLGWMGIVATAAGLFFPIVIQTLESPEASISRLAGWADAADNFGGALGALVTGILLVPFFGLMQTFYVFAGLKLLTHLYLFLGREKREP